METILREVKDLNETGESTMNFIGIKMNQNSQLPPIKRISIVEMQERREKKKLWYYCDEKYELVIKVKESNFFY